MRLKQLTIDLNKRRPASDIHVEENNVDDPTAIENHLASTSSVVNSQTHTETLNFHRPTVHNVQNTITRPITKTRILSIQYCEDKEFGKLLKMLNPRYDLPSRKTLSTSVLSVLYNDMYDKVKSDIEENGNFVSITTGGWTSVKNEIIKEWGLENRVSACTLDNALNITRAIDYANGGMYIVLLIA
ncbi:hypothetical protein QTP88_020720 [Uroleucon formosanum]